MSVVHLHQLTKGDYFYTEKGLYYVELAVDEEYLVENCMTYNHHWLKFSDLEALDYTLIEIEEVISD